MDFNCKVYYKSCENKRTPCRCSKGVMGGKVIISHYVVEFQRFNVFLVGVQ